jgi:polysaccharide export outer membrane protein
LLALFTQSSDRKYWIEILLASFICLPTVLLVPAEASALQAEAPTDGTAKPKDKPKGKADAKDPAGKPEAGGTETPATSDAYRIGLDDTLTISVWKEPELTSVVVVRPDGMITLPLLNELKVVGLKPIELQQLLAEKLKPFVAEPQVTVIVQGIKSRKVFLVGQIAKQGQYPLEGGETVLQLLAAAGGLGPFAKADSIYILRNENGKQVRIPFKYKKALQGRSGSNDILLVPGDVVVVP